MIPAIAGEVASLTVYQRTAHWCTPLNNAPITSDEQARLRADFEAIRETLNTSPAGFLHPAHDRATFDDPDDERLAFFEKMWNSPGFSKLTSNYTDLLFDHAANAEWCEFIADKIRIDRRGSRDRREADPDGPPVRRAPAAVRDRLLRGVQPTERVARRPEADADRAHDGDRHRDRPTACASSTSSCGRRGSTSARARCRGWGSAAETVVRSRTIGPTVLGRSSASRPPASRTSSSRVVRTRRPATTRATTATRWTSSPTRSATSRERGYDTIEVEPEAEESVDRRWSTAAPRRHPSFGESSYYFGTNIPGKPRKYLLNSAGRPKLFKEIAKVIETDYASFMLSRSPEPPA